MFPLNPILLYLGIGAVSVPIIIHLLNRRRFQRVVWAAMRFIRVSVEQNQRRLQIEDLILLLLRCLLVLLLGLALSRPVISRLAKALFGSQVTAVLILDNSYSMGMSDGTMTRFEKAKKAALQALDTMPAGSAAALILASDVPQALIPEPSFDLNLARRLVGEAVLSDRTTDLAPSIDRALETLQRRLLLRGEVYVLTDGQSIGWRHLAKIQKALDQVRSKIRSHIVLVGEHEEHNLGVSELRLASGLTPIKQPLRFEVRVANYGRQEVRDVRVALNVDSDPPSDEFTIESLPAGASKSISLFTRLRTEGFHSVTARLGEDRLPADDKRTLALRALKEVRVLLVDGEPGTEGRDSETFFLRHALVPVPVEEAAEYFIKPVVITPSDLAGARLDEFDAVFLANVAELSEAVARNLESYLRRGGGLAIFPGAKINPTFYNETLAKKLNLLPATFGPPRGQADQEDKFFTLQERNFDHPIVSIWNDPASGTLSSARFFRALELTPVPFARAATNRGDRSGPDGREAGPGQPEQEAGEPRVIVSFSDGKAAAVARDFGLGRVVMFASTADTAWNDLPVRLAFVPLMHRTLGALVQRHDEGLNIRVGGKFTRRVPAECLGKDALIFKPRTTDAIARDTRRIELLGGAPAFQYDQTDQAGVYEVTVGGLEPPVLIKFAAQADPTESLLDELSEEQKKMLASVSHVVEWGPKFSFKEQVERERRGSEFWLPLFLAALLVAVVEMALGQWFSRSR
jgi:hypothetical protein